jgi:predicted signal transduction protein with EAL and GGDEF domain
VLGGRRLLPGPRRRRLAQLLHAADGALYWAKRSGRDRVRAFDPRHVVRCRSPSSAAELEAVLSAPGAVAPVFQPVMEVATGRIAGYEALARFAPPYARPPLTWFEQAHRCGPRRRARGVRDPRRARRAPAARPAPSWRSTSRRPRCSRPRSSARSRSTSTAS